MEAVLEMIMVFTGDERYREIKEEIMKLVTEGREVTMCTFIKCQDLMYKKYYIKMYN